MSMAEPRGGQTTLTITFTERFERTDILQKFLGFTDKTKIPRTTKKKRDRNPRTRDVW